MLHPVWSIQTGRLWLTPVGWQDLSDLTVLKADPGVYAQMLGGVRGPLQVAEELAADVAFWSRHGVGMWMVRDLDEHAIGLTGLHERTDGRGIALRFAFRPEARGRGLAREAAGAALRFAHDRAGIPRVIAVAKETNYSSRTVLGAIGMVPVEMFERDRDRMWLFESRISPKPAAASR